MNVREAVTSWRTFASTVHVNWHGNRRSWEDHISRGGFVDEEQLIQPDVFPRFASEFLGFVVGENLAPEQGNREGIPDFTPADSLTHPFVFETKSTQAGVPLRGYETQVANYLERGRPRICKVVLTNLVGLRVFDLSEHGALTELYSVNLLLLLGGHIEQALGTRDAESLAQFIDEFRFHELSSEQKVIRVRESAPWNPGIEPTSADWISARLDRVVTILDDDVQLQVVAGALVNPEVMDEARREHVVSELRYLAWRLGVEWEETQATSLDAFLAARPESPLGKAMQQYQLHVAYYSTTRLLLVRIWEDLGLLEASLYDGGFDTWMKAFRDVIRKVISHSFDEAKQRYGALFGPENNYTWYMPGEECAAKAIYELANTYFGDIRSDVLGVVYERLLERVDRKLLGQYYTPRDVISLIWDLIGPEAMLRTPELDGRELRVLDIAAGSGGFLVEVAARMRSELEKAIALGADLSRQQWVRDAALGLNGIEIQPFSAYLAELNLLIQLGTVMAREPDIAIPPLGVVTTDTLSLHNPEELFPDGLDIKAGELGAAAADRIARAQRLRKPADSDFWLDVACGNPPYVGEKSAAAIMAETRRLYPYWNQYVGPHMDYLYWFVILGVSKLRKGGRFGFITTEYWLRADGARPLRGYLASRCRVEKIILFRNLRLFPDAPGQHSLVVIGERVVENDLDWDGEAAPRSLPRVSVYEGPMVPEKARVLALGAMRAGATRAGVRTFVAAESPNTLGGNSWASVALTKAQLGRRRRLTKNSRPLALDSDEGVLTSADTLSDPNADKLSRETLNQIGWVPGARPGIFVLTRPEVDSLGNLNAGERSVLLPVVNTCDVLPYACCLPDSPPVLLNLVAPPREPGLSMLQAQSLPFPDGHPNLERHLDHYRPVLEAKLRGYDERRPWWSIHRPRPDIQARLTGKGGWADYCLTTRWGGGQQLIVGLAPEASVPASGLHALFAPAGVPAAYVSALMNSSAVQELAETLPPGAIRVTDLQALNLPLLADVVELLAAEGLALADLVLEANRVHSKRFPKLMQTLMSDVSLAAVDDTSWLPVPGQRRDWGTLEKIAWCTELVPRGSQNLSCAAVEVFEELWGHGVRIKTKMNTSLEVRVEQVGVDELGALAAYARGLVAARVPLRDVPNLPMPIVMETLARQLRSDRDALRTWLETYQGRRAVVDGIVDVAL